MTEPKPKPCNHPGCGVPITFQMVDGKPKPFNIDGSLHLHLRPAPAAKPDKIELKGGYGGINKFGQIGIKRKDGAILMMSTSCKPDPVIREGDRVIATIEHDFIVDLLLDPEHYVTKEPALKNGKQILQENLDAKKAGNPACFPDSSDLDKEREAYNARAAQAKTTMPDKDVPIPPPSEKDIWMQEREKFYNLLTSTGRDGMPELLNYLENETDFFIAPSSTKYHDARDGGLLHHSIEVYRNLILLSPLFEGDYPPETLIIIGLLHDLCKANFYKTSFRNVKHEERPYGDQWVKEPYIDIDDQFPLGHGEKSVILLQRYIRLTDLEIMAIRWHMMAYDDLHYSYAGNIAITGASSKYPIIPLMHMADLSASFLKTKEPANIKEVGE